MQMATTMTLAESSIELGIPPDKAHAKWLEWTKEGGPGMGLKFGSSSEEISAQQLPEELRNAERGTASFEPGESGGSRVRVQLRYNRDVIEKEKMAPDWVDKRISLYLQRFKNFAEGRQA
jgi:hypothetical protein